MLPKIWMLAAMIAIFKHSQCVPMVGNQENGTNLESYNLASNTSFPLVFTRRSKRNTDFDFKKVFKGAQEVMGVIKEIKSNPITQIVTGLASKHPIFGSIISSAMDLFGTNENNNAEIIQGLNAVRKDIADVKKGIEDLKNDIKDLKKDIQELMEKMFEMQKELIDQIQTSTTEIKEMIQKVLKQQKDIQWQNQVSIPLAQLGFHYDAAIKSFSQNDVDTFKTVCGESITMPDNIMTAIVTIFETIDERVNIFHYVDQAYVTINKTAEVVLKQLYVFHQACYVIRNGEPDEQDAATNALKMETQVKKIVNHLETAIEQQKTKWWTEKNIKAIIEENLDKGDKEKTARQINRALNNGFRSQGYFFITIAIQVPTNDVWMVPLGNEHVYHKTGALDIFVFRSPVVTDKCYKECDYMTDFKLESKRTKWCDDHLKNGPVYNVKPLAQDITSKCSGIQGVITQANASVSYTAKDHTSTEQPVAYFDAYYRGSSQQCFGGYEALIFTLKSITNC